MVSAGGEGGGGGERGEVRNEELKGAGETRREAKRRAKGSSLKRDG